MNITNLFLALALLAQDAFASLTDALKQLTLVAEAAEDANAKAFVDQQGSSANADASSMPVATDPLSAARLTAWVVKTRDD